MMEVEDVDQIKSECISVMNDFLDHYTTGTDLWYDLDTIQKYIEIIYINDPFRFKYKMDIHMLKTMDALINIENPEWMDLDSVAYVFQGMEELLKQQDDDNFIQMFNGIRIGNNPYAL